MSRSPQNLKIRVPIPPQSGNAAHPADAKD